MSQFKLSEGIDNNKIFLVNRSQLNGRFDPQFHAELPDLTGFIKLDSIAHVNGGKRIPLGYDYSNDVTDFLYLRVTDISHEGKIDYTKIKYIDKAVFEILERYEITNGELAISIAGTIGRIMLIEGIPLDKSVILTENCAKLALKNNTVLNSYFSLILNLSVHDNFFKSMKYLTFYHLA